MKRCPECRRDYYDDTLLYCLDDGNALLEGPATADEPATAILSEPGAVATGFLASESPTRAQINTTDQTAIFHRGAEAEPQKNLDEMSERQSPSANRAVEPQSKRKKLLAIFGIAVLLLVAGFFGYRYFAPANSKQIESIAVMPFVNESGNADVEYLSDGMTETLISSLSQLPNLNVKARSSVFRYKGKDTDAQVIAKELNVQAVLTGKVVQRASELSLYVELVDAASDKVIWSETYNRPMTNLVALQKDIARDVSNNLQTKLSGADEQKLAKNYTANTEAYQLYLRGRFFWNKRSLKDSENSIPYFQQAIAADPSFALAYAGLADSYVTLALFEGGMPTREVMPKARDAALKALTLDDRLAEARATLGFILLNDYDFAGSEREFKRAIELEPNYGAAHLRYSELLSSLGRHEESLAEMRRALEIEPLSVFVNRAYGLRLFSARRYDESILQLKKTLELDNNFALTHSTLALLYQVHGDYSASIEEIAKAYELTGRKDSAELARESFAKSGWQGYLRAIMKHRSDLLAYSRARFHTALGEKEKAIDELNKAYENREALLIRLKTDPGLDPLRDDPRFRELLRKVGFPQ